MKLDDIRREYVKAGLKRSNMNADPMTQLEFWLQEAKHLGMVDMSAMTLATVDQSGQPSQRVVLLKHLDQNGLVFFTNLSSKKAKDISVNRKVSAHFAWLKLERQVKIQGVASKLSKSEVLKYFVSRPRDSQLAAWASNQSNPISSRQILMSAFDQIKQKFSNGEVPLPDFWGGYRIKPSAFEFWQGGSARLHDRFAYSSTESGWSIQRLAP